MPNIDNLSIQVAASAAEASRILDRLASSASKVKVASQGASGGMRDMAQSAQDAGTVTQEVGEQAGRAEKNMQRFGKSTEDAGRSAKKGTSGITSFWNALRRIAFYRFIRSVIKEITAAFGEGIKNLYQWSDAVNGHFAASMDRLATSSQYLKNSLGAMVSPLIETLIPVLDVIIDRVVDVLNFFNMLVSAVSGAGTYTVAKKASAVWDDSANKTRKAAKSAADDIKRTILGFDEINKLVKPNFSSGGSGSGSGKSTPNYSAMFEERPINSTGFGSALSKWVESEIGRINAIVDASAMALGLILALHGSPVGFGLLAAGALDMGASIVAYDDRITPEIKAAISGILGIAGIGLAIGAVLAFSSANIGLGLGLMVASIGALGGSYKIASVNWDVISELLRGPIGTVTGLISGASLVLGILALCGGMIPLGIGLILAGAAGLAATVSANLNNLKDLGVKAIESVKAGWDTLKNKAFEIAVFIGTKVSDLWNGLKKAWFKMGDIFLAIGAKISTTAQAIWNGLTKAWGSATNWVLGVWAQVKTTSKMIWTAVSSAWGDATKWVLGVWAQVKTTSKNIWTAVSNAWGSATKWVLGIWAQVKTTSKNIWDAVSTAWGSATKWVLGVWAQVKTTSKTIWTAVSTAWGDATKWVLGIWAQVKTTSRTIWTAVSTAWGDATKWVLGVWAQVKTTSRMIWTAVSTAWGAATNWVLGVWATVRTASNTIWKGVTDAWGKAEDWVLGIWAKITTPIQTLWRLLTGDWATDITNDPDKYLKISAAITTTAQKLWNDIKKAWDDFIQEIGGFLEIKIVPVLSSIGKGVKNGVVTAGNWIGDRASDLWHWLFPGAQAEEANLSVNVNATPGRGFKSNNLSRKQAFELDDSIQQGLNNNPLEIPADLQKGWSGTPQSALGVDNLKSTVDVDMWTPWNYWHTPPIKWLQMDNLESTVKVDMWTPWWSLNESALEWLQMDNLVATVNVVANVTNAQSSIKAATNFSGSYKAKGGVFSNNRWTDVPQYAGGTLNAHGSLFLAGEAGPEIVGHVGGRTEVLNKSQIAAAMYSAVQAAMAPATATMAYAAQSMGGSDTEIDYTGMYDIIRDAVAQALANDSGSREQTQLLRQISDKDFSAEITTSSMNKAQMRMNRRAGVTLVPVGT